MGDHLNADTLYRDCVIQGERAACEGRMIGENPYPAGSAQHDGFRDGWNRAIERGRFNAAVAIQQIVARLDRYSVRLDR